MKYVLALTLSLFVGCTRTNDESACTQPTSVIEDVEKPTLKAVAPVDAPQVPVEDAPTHEVLRTELGNDHLGRSWFVENVRKLGCDDWQATFHLNGAKYAGMEIGRLKCGHSPVIRLEVWPARATFVVLEHISTWGIGVWGSSEFWYALDRLEDHEQHVLHVRVTGRVYGWGLAFNRELSANSCRAPGLDVAVQVASRLDVLSGDTELFEVFRHATYRWDESRKRFVAEDNAADYAVRGMWDFGEDGVVTHYLPELTQWFSSSKGSSEFLRELLIEVETHDARDVLNSLLDSRGG